MCGIVGAVAQRDVTEILLTGLKRLEYRGYDSAGIALIADVVDDEATEKQKLYRCRSLGKLEALTQRLKSSPRPVSKIGIGHSRWATHGKPTEKNAHPHVSPTGKQPRIAIVHNGIIENHHILREQLKKAGFEFDSDTDSEVIVHLLMDCLNSGAKTVQQALAQVMTKLEGSFALAVIDEQSPQQLIVARKNSPLVIGIGIGEHFIASDALALLPVTHQFIYLQDDDLAVLTATSYQIYQADQEVTREVKLLETQLEQVERGEYRHFMQKEMFEQPNVIEHTLAHRIEDDQLATDLFPEEALSLFKAVNRVQIVACGTSFHAALVAKYWLEEIANISCDVEIASEWRYRKKVINHELASHTLFMTISQSGETADTLAALMQAKTLNYLATLTICNVPESALVRHSDYCLLTQAGTEIGVASTKAFTTQLVALYLLTLILAKQQNQLPLQKEKQCLNELARLPQLIRAVLQLDKVIESLAIRFADKAHSLFLGRGIEYPIALEGALKLKEVSYIHAEAYAAGELKHGPLALVDHNMPIISVAPNNHLLEKLKSNLHEVKSRGGQLIVFADQNAGFQDEVGVTVINLPHIDPLLAPILYVIPLQLLSYHVALIKGTDVDQPRNLAKSVTVE